MNSSFKPKYNHDDLMKLVNPDTISWFKQVLARMHHDRSTAESDLRELKAQHERLLGTEEGEPDYVVLGRVAWALKKAEETVEVKVSRLNDAEAFYTLVKDFVEMKKGARQELITWTGAQHVLSQIIKTDLDTFKLYTAVGNSSKSSQARSILRRFEDAVAAARELHESEDYNDTDSFPKRMLTANVPVDFLAFMPKL